MYAQEPPESLCALIFLVASTVPKKSALKFFGGGGGGGGRELDFFSIISLVNLAQQKCAQII